MAEDAGVRAIAAAAYLVTALVVAGASRTAKARERHFWLVTAAILVLLGGAKQFQIHGSLTGAFRQLAQAGGWYESHREIQTAFAGLAIMSSLAAGVVCARWLRHCVAAVKAVAALLGALLVFLMLRLASIHAVDTWTITEIGGVRRGWWVELAATTLIAACAAAYAAQVRSGRVAQASIKRKGSA